MVQTATAATSRQQHPPESSILPHAPSALAASSRHQRLDLEPVEVGVCCGCRPAPRRRWRKLTTSLSRRLQPRYYDAQQKDCDASSSHLSKESMYFFDAEQEPLAENDYDYPPWITTTVQHPKPKVSLDDPTSLLRPEGFDGASSAAVDFTGGIRKSALAGIGGGGVTGGANHKQKSVSFRRYESPTIADHQQPSSRFHTLVQRTSTEHIDQLESPRVAIPLQGYPGGLTQAELVECQKFIKGLQEDLDPAISQQVYTFRDIEEPPYTICRWLRATKFDARSILERLKDNQSIFEIAKEADFYPNVDEAIGAPFSVFLSQYPFLPIGRGLNGCPVNYFCAGKIHPEGIMTLTTPKQLTGYFWWSFMYKFKQEIRKAQATDPDFVRVEGINILDLSGLSSAALTSETIDVVKLASQISDFFPETLHCMLIINAPGFFSMFWGFIKKFIDPRTAVRIQVFSSKEKGLAALRQLVAVEEIPADYGGTNISLADAFVKEAADPLLKAQNIELLHIKRKGGKASIPAGWNPPSSSISSSSSASGGWKIGYGEYMEIQVYTRSVSAAIITVFFNNKEHTTVESGCGWNMNDSEPTSPRSQSTQRSVSPLPQCTSVVSRLQGPGEVRLIAQDLDTAEKNHNPCSRGYFLVVGDLKKDA